MISRRLLLSLLFFLAPSFCFAYSVEIRTANSSVDLTSYTDVGKYLGFEVLKMSLQRRNISFTFNSNGLYSAAPSGYQYANDCVINGERLILYTTSRVVLWPRETDNEGACQCDYAIFCAFSENRQDTTQALKWYLYFDYGVCIIRNYFGARMGDAIATKSVIYEPNISNSMPILMADNAQVIYFQNPTRIYNIYYSRSGLPLSEFLYGSLQEYLSPLATMTLYYSGSVNSTWSGTNTYSLTNKTVLTQSSLPWQMQSNNPGYDNQDHVKPEVLAVADTDGGSEPDVSEYFNAHNYLDPDDDWRQPADIGGGGSGAGGEITGFSQGAQGQMTGSAETALENYFGSSSDLDVVPPEAYDEELETRADLDLEQTFVSQVTDELSDNLPDGFDSFQEIIDALKNPTSDNIPTITLPFTFDLRGFHNGSFINPQNKPVIDFGFLLQAPYQNYFNNARVIVVIFLAACVVIYILQDMFFLGHNGSGE